MQAGADPGGGAIGASAPPESYESNFFHYDFLQFGKTLDCQLRLDCQILLKSPPPLNWPAGSDAECKTRIGREACSQQVSPGITRHLAILNI